MMSGPKADELPLELFQTIFGCLGWSATHDQAFHVRAVLHQVPLGFGERPLRGESTLLVSYGHRCNMRPSA